MFNAYAFTCNTAERALLVRRCFGTNSHLAALWEELIGEKVCFSENSMAIEDEWGSRGTY